VKCILCAHPAQLYFLDEKTKHDYFHCAQCDLRFLNPEQRPNPAQEKARYELHDVQNVEYENYLKPVATWVKAHCQPGAQGLDFGCGKRPVLAQLLAKNDYRVTSYDPYFYPDKTYSEKKFDFIVAVEVAEHFYSPAKEFTHLKSLLTANGGLGIVTALYTNNIDFNSWYYRRDPTHVCFYSAATFKWICHALGFSSYESSENRLNWLQL
jgi:cyclopropane fatty-acyl-phospholipid synthase-like methyltransferase